MTQNERSTPYDWEELTKRWERDEITLEQLAGQLLIWSQQLHEMLVRGQRTQESIQSEQDGVMHSLADLDARLIGVEEQIKQL